MKKELSLGKIAEMLDGDLKGPANLLITSVAPPGAPYEGAICPLWESKFRGLVKDGAVLLTKKGWTEGRAGVEVDDPRAALVRLLEFFSSEERRKCGIATTAVVSKDAKVGVGVFIGPGCIVSEGAELGDGCMLEANVWIGRGVTVGAGTRIDAGAVLYEGSATGLNCVIHACAVIGCEGFGFISGKEQTIRRIPHIGRAVLEDFVEIGAFTSVDRATFGETRIGMGTKIDSHVKIGHNCTVGCCCFIAAQSGLAGSTTLGDGVTCAAQVGIGNHVKIGGGVTIGARSVVFSDIEQGATVSGFPAVPHKEHLRQMALMKKLPQMAKQLKELLGRIENGKR